MTMQNWILELCPSTFLKVWAKHAGGQTGAATVMVAERAADILSGNALRPKADMFFGNAVHPVSDILSENAVYANADHKVALH